MPEGLFHRTGDFQQMNAPSLQQPHGKGARKITLASLPSLLPPPPVLSSQGLNQTRGWRERDPCGHIYCRPPSQAENRVEQAKKRREVCGENQSPQNDCTDLSKCKLWVHVSANPRPLHLPPTDSYWSLSLLSTCQISMKLFLLLKRLQVV